MDGLEAAAQQLTLIARLDRLLQSEAHVDPAYHVRQLAQGDRNSLADLFFRSYGRDVVAEKTAAVDEIEITYQGEYGELDLAASPAITFAGRLVGAVMTVHEAPWSDTPSGPFVIEVMVQPSHRRRGLAQAALVAAAKSLIERGSGTVGLRVMSDNMGARALYEKLSFTPWAGVRE